METKIEQALAPAVGVIVRGTYTAYGEVWTLNQNTNRRYKDGLLFLPQSFMTSKHMVLPIAADRWSASVAMTKLPWSCAGGMFKHLLAGEDCPQTGCLMMHRKNDDTMEVVLITNATPYLSDLRFLATMCARTVTTDPDIERKMLDYVNTGLFTCMPMSNDLPQLLADLSIQRVA
jgi:hypothetical protein